ncbi:Ferritin-like domain-containing protein [Bryocella elongata]|uniref:Ferritin-like domain-containing protein n=1 Tax=Bryocella elongata TaxID=863522 RepID=A0A1H5WXF9_9BACT|nr:ferritin-like domain-containing protein [Bryocella elongata]SEG03850.1 Ferritin-like domain-containing protein [Bryocella elongata]
MPTLETQQLDEVIASSRRRMLTMGGAAIAGLALSAIAADAQTTTLTDADYLNFALNLEYLEAQYYTLAVSGMTIDQMGLGITGTGTQGTVTVKAGGYTACKVPFANTIVQSYATEIALEERNHVSFLRSALGTAAVAQPAIDLVNSFNYLSTLLGLGLTSFDPFANDINFLLGSYIFEDVGVTAYTGAAPALTVSGNLDAAAGIQAVEAYHAGMVRTTIYGLDQSATTLGAAGTARAVATAISKVRASADGSNSTTSSRAQGDDIGLGTQTVALNTSSSFTASTLVDASTTGSINAAGSTGTAGSLVFARTAAQVLGIVYAGGTTTSNQGFFRAGLNGNVK